MSDIEFFWGSGSQPAWSVMLALEVKRVAYTSRLLSFGAGDHKTPEFLQLNPRHKVPVIRDGEFVLNESVAILVYLDRKFPEPPLFGRSAEEAGLVWRAISEFQSYVRPPLLEHLVQPIYAGKVTENRARIEEQISGIHAELQKYEATLTKRPWLVGNALSAADLLIFPYFMSILRAVTRPAAEGLKLGILPIEKVYPHLSAWVTRIEALPGYDRTFPPHWR
jgi:glutathione S-transferase